ncbi:putative DNA-binding transcriptional regulator YafY [Stella humosa]|uniref:Putative DNA-binding transcriptional regulator YafY n=2 Tax=Stella humosa TaxID=94 RepID=A0A3N1MGD6_9PROT|nr:putative DNA-binding transcriptional regulator YafY [Stella humosa]
MAMRRGDRLFEIIQLLRATDRPMTAAALGQQLEVTVRTVYRDISALQARRVPIEGAAGIGYILRPGFDLPPLMFTLEEIDAIAVGARMVRRLRDDRLRAAADSVLGKVAVALPEALRDRLVAAPLYVSDGSAATAAGIDLTAARRAIGERRKMRIAYADGQNQRSERTVWPIAMAYYVDVTLLAAWCEMRRDYRHFRVDRIRAATVLEERYPDDGGRMMAAWLALPKE